ncbi:MAG: thiamine-phosphate kinase [Woeseiaceae bacterium]
MSSEFEIIRQYFNQSQSPSRADVIVGIGDDAAILAVPEKHQLVQSVDTLIAGVHFPIETSAADIAYKALAVNLSDMAAMGAEPAWFTLAITLPNDNHKWLKEFSSSLSLLSNKFGVQLVGGDTTHGSLSLSITINGFVPIDKALRRDQAKVGDKVYVSGTIGDAALALSAWQGDCCLENESIDFLNNKLNRPLPQINLGLLLRDYASSCIDISDGLIADLEHITDMSKVGAEINFQSIPLSKEFLLNNITKQHVLDLVLSCGDDYQLCFTIPKSKQEKFESEAKKENAAVSCIGEITSGSDVTCFYNGEILNRPKAGYNHFSEEKK